MKVTLQSMYDKRKSFYQKALITIDSVLWGTSTELKAPGEKHLYSYNSEVCYIDNAGKVHLLPLWNYSATTLRHVKEFLKQNGFRADNSKQIKKDYFN
jgi:hypothetical protein